MNAAQQIIMDFEQACEVFYPQEWRTAMFKSEKREIKRRNARKMKVSGKSVFTMKQAQRKRDLAFEQARKGKRISPMSV